MTPPSPSADQTVLHIPAGHADWAGVLTQFSMHLLQADSRAFAAWAGERLLRATRASDGVVALADGHLQGLLLFEIVDRAAELTFPWTRASDPDVGRSLAEAALQVIRDGRPDVRHVRVERQLLSDEPDPRGLQAAGFECHWRRRMTLELAGWSGDVEGPPGYTLMRWHIRDLDAAAKVIYRANLGTLDARLYAPFFGESTAQCRKGLLAILAGRHGPIHPQATLCVFAGEALVGVNLVISPGVGTASVVEISVDPAHQRKGLGRLLMVRSLRILKHENTERVELAVTRENTPAVSLYASLGFVDAGEFPVCVWPESS